MVDVAPSPTPLTVDEYKEAAERRSAEIEFVTSAYSPDEVCISKDNLIINRRLNLSFSDDGDGGAVVQVNLTLKLPETYPIREDAILIIDASLRTCPTNPPHIRKAALNAIPYLVETCQLNARAAGGGEAIWSVLTSADEWVCDNKLEDYAAAQTSSQKANHQSNSTDTENDDNIRNNTLILGRRIIYSHHIIANSKRRGLADLASQYNLGGYAKIGWPGIILIEGDESHCQLFVEEIKRWRWQQIQVRGEEQSDPIVLPSPHCLDDLRLLPMKFEEIEESDGGLSTLAAKCREVGLERLFFTCMKINDHRTNLSVEEESGNTVKNDIKDGGSKEYYGVLVHVDHMNDPKRYHKWLKKTCQAQGCTLLIRQVYKEDNKPDSDDKTTTITKRQQQSLSEYLENNLHQSSRL